MHLKKQAYVNHNVEREETMGGKLQEKINHFINIGIL